MTKTTVGAEEPPEQPAKQLRDPHAERAVLGTVLLHPAISRHLVAILDAEDFTSTVHREIFASSVAAAARGQDTDPINISAELERRGSTATGQLLHHLVATAPVEATAVYYAAIVRDLAGLRRKQSDAGHSEGFPELPLRGFLHDDDH